MNRKITHTKPRLAFLIRDLLERDVMQAPHYAHDSRAVEGFEKRAALEFLLWFIEEALPADFAFDYIYDELEEQYGAALAQKIVESRSWSDPQLRETDAIENVSVVDFRSPRDDV